MRKMKFKEPTWNEVKASIKNLDRSELLDLVKDLFQLSKANKSFFFARYSIGDQPLQFYKKLIEDALYPDVRKRDILISPLSRENLALKER